MNEEKNFIEIGIPNSENQKEGAMSLVKSLNEKRLDGDFVELAELISTDIANLLIEDDERRSGIANRTARVSRVITMYLRDIGVEVACMDRLSGFVVNRLVNEMGIIESVGKDSYKMCGDCDFFKKLKEKSKYSGVESLSEMKRAGHETADDLKRFQEEQ